MLLMVVLILLMVVASPLQMVCVLCVCVCVAGALLEPVMPMLVKPAVDYGMVDVCDMLFASHGDSLLSRSPIFNVPNFMN